jgi:hypothetical protein
MLKTDDSSGPAAVRLLGLWVRIPQGGMDVCIVTVVLSGTVLRVGLITRPEVVPSVMCLSVTVKPLQCKGSGQLGAVAPWET